MPSELGAAGRQISRAASIFSTMSPDKIPQDSLRKDEHRQIEERKIRVKNMLIDLEMGLQRQYDACINFWQQKAVIKFYQAKLAYYKKV